MAGAGPGKAALFELLKKRREEAGGPTLGRRRAEWIFDVTQLINRLMRWLQEPRQKGLLKYRKRQIPITEEGLPPYSVPMLTIEAPGSWSVDVRPIGMHVVGAMGRVDLLAAARQNTIARVDRGKWQFVRLDETGTRWLCTDLTEDSFFSALRELLQ